MEGAARCPHSPVLGVPSPGQAVTRFGVTRRGDGRKSGRKGAGLVSHHAQSPLSALSSRDFAGFRPQNPPESAPPTASGRRRTVSESSCVAPMHAASLTKGYGGNPPSGRSVSPPRTGPFFLPAVRRPSCPPSGTAPVAIRHSLAAPRGPPLPRRPARPAGHGRPGPDARPRPCRADPDSRDVRNRRPTDRRRRRRRGRHPAGRPRSSGSEAARKRRAAAAQLTKARQTGRWGPPPRRGYASPLGTAIRAGTARGRDRAACRATRRGAAPVRSVRRG
ncbi:hypothetical protein SUDANB13_02183 [Streptomyces sp. enrichment culture]